MAGSFADLLRGYRAAANLTQEELAARSGLSVQAIGLLERGSRRSPRPRTVASLAGALELEPGQRRALVAAARGRREPGSDAVPGQLPRAVRDFAGRRHEIELVAGLLAGDAAAPPVVVITGAAGVGKTALALRAAHQHLDRFPDGQLFHDLQRAGGAPIPSGDVLAAFLRALGMDGAAIPDAPEERRSLYRARLLDRRVLVVLDNAADEAQVRDLLPSGRRCAALVTSRGPLSGLEGARAVPLDVLAPREALDLLAGIAGRDRVDADGATAADIARLCGCLPLAVRIAGARLAARPRWSLRTLAERLGDERRRLDELRAGDLEVRASLALSYRGLDAATRRAFRLLGVLDVPDLPAWLVGGLLDLGPGDTDRLLDRLVDARLLEHVGEDGAGQARHRLHGLVRLFARELAREEGETARAAAVARTLGVQLALCELAQRAISPGEAAQIATGAAIRRPPADPDLLALVADDPITWFEAERECLLAGVRQACRDGFHEAAWELACRMTTFFRVRGRWQDWRATHATVLRAVRRAGNRRGELHVAWQLGECHLWLWDLRRARTWLERGERMAGVLGDDRRAACARLGLAFAASDGDDPVLAEARFAASLEAFRAMGDPHGEAVARAGTGLTLLRQGRHAEAAATLDTAIRQFRRCPDREWEAIAGTYLAAVHDEDGRPADAVRCLTAAMDIYRELGNVWHATRVRCRLAVLRHDRYGSAAAAGELAACARVFAELGVRADEERAGELLRQLRVAR